MVPWPWSPATWLPPAVLGAPEHPGPRRGPYLPSKPWWPLLGGAKVCLTLTEREKGQDVCPGGNSIRRWALDLATSASKGSRRQWPWWRAHRVWCGASERVGPAEALPFSPGPGGARHAPPLHREQIPWPAPTPPAASGLQSRGCWPAPTRRHWRATQGTDGLEPQGHLGASSKGSAPLRPHLPGLWAPPGRPCSLAGAGLGVSGTGWVWGYHEG